MTKEQNNREEESEGKGAGNKTIELAWNELKWIKLQKGKKRKKRKERRVTGHCVCSMNFDQSILLAYLWMLKWAALLRLKEPCLWRKDQILPSNMYEAAHLSTHIFSFSFSLTNIQIHNLYTNTGYSGDFTVTPWRNIQTQTLSQLHTQGDPDYLLTVQYLHCRAFGGSLVCVVVCAITPHSTSLHLPAIHKEKLMQTSWGIVYVSADVHFAAYSHHWPIWY